MALKQPKFITPEVIRDMEEGLKRCQQREEELRALRALPPCRCALGLPCLLHTPLI